MVIEDISLNRRSIHSDHFTLPNHLDRLFASVIDFLIFSPFVALFTSGILADFKTNSITGDFSSHGLLISQYVFLVFVLFISYESLFVYFLQATPGHYFLYQRIVSTDSHRKQLSLLRILFRSTFKFLGFLFSFIPFVEILLSSERRAFYDRVTETKIISLKRKKTDDEILPAFKQALQRILYVTVALVFLGFGFYFYHLSQEIIVSEFSEEKVLERNSSEDAAVKEASAKIPKCEKSFEFYAERLIAHQADKNTMACLYKLSYHQNDKYYFYRFVETSDRNLKSRYLAKICEQKKLSFFCESSLNAGLKIASHDLNDAKSDKSTNSAKNSNSAKNLKNSQENLDEYKSENFIYYSYLLNQALQERDFVVALKLFDQMYDDITWSDKLENQYIKTFLMVEQSQNRRPASAINDSMIPENYALDYTKFKKRMGL